MNVIKPLEKEELLTFLDRKSQQVLKYFITKALFSQPEILPQQQAPPIQVPKEHIEQWFTQALKVKPIGAGSYPIDIYNVENKWGADIKMLSVTTDEKGTITNQQSGEASLGQNFSDAGVDLDNLFKNKKHDQIKDKWVRLYKNKFESIKRSYPIEKVYYFFILRSASNFYLVGAKINVNFLDKVEVDKTRTTKNSVFLNGFIDSEYGNSKIYKAKKRLELRLLPRKWIDSGHSVIFRTNFKAIESDLREVIDDPNLLQSNLDKINKLKIEIT